MKFTTLAPGGPVLVEIEPKRDARGLFARLYCDEEFARTGLNSEWKQINLSVNSETGTLRGLHFQRPPAAEIKLVRCLSGQVLDVVVDMRREAETFGRAYAVRLDGERRQALYIPEGFAHGFQTLEPETELQYMHSALYAPGHEGGVNPLDPALGIEWPLPPVNMSERDRTLPDLKDVEPL